MVAAIVALWWLLLWLYGYCHSSCLAAVTVAQRGAPERFLTRVGSELTRKHQTRLERFTREKHSSLLQKSVNYGRKKFYSTGPRGELRSLINEDINDKQELKKAFNLQFSCFMTEIKNHEMDHQLIAVKCTNRQQKIIQIKVRKRYFILIAKPFFFSLPFLLSKKVSSVH